MKKMLVGAFLGMFALAGVAVLPNYDSAQGNWETGFWDGEWWWATSDDKVRNEGADWYSTTGDGASLLTTIRRAINWVLWILATITLVIMIYAGFLMVTSAGDDKKYQKGLWIIKYAAIWLAIIGLSWLIVSVIFWFINTAQPNEPTPSGS